MGLEFTPEQKQISAVFFEANNDIDIYTEDNQKDQKFYITLFQRLLDGSGIKLNKTYQLGSKNDVIECCKKDNSPRKHIYIVDGDYGLQCEKYPNDLQSIPHLYILDFYCIENGLICPTGFIKAIDNFTGGVYSNDEVLSFLDYDNTLGKITPKFIELFFYFSAYQELGECIDYGCLARYIIPKTNKLNINAIQKKIDDIITLSKSKGIDKELTLLVQKREQIFKKDVKTLLKLVSGKDFIIPYIVLTISLQIKKMKNKTYAGQTMEWWKYNIVQFCNLDKFETLRHAIINA